MIDSAFLHQGIEDRGKEFRTDLSTHRHSSEAKQWAICLAGSTFASERFQSRLQHFPRETLILADEVHNLGAAMVRSALPENIAFRLGLSATPERWFDDDGTSALYSYFGKILEPVFTLKDAIDCGALCRYAYYPILVSLTDDEAREYRQLSSQIARLGTSTEDTDEHIRLLDVPPSV